jgi:hypothetical protein
VVDKVVVVALAVVIAGNTAPANATTRAKNTTYTLARELSNDAGVLMVVDSNSAHNGLDALLTLENLVFKKQLVSFQTSFSGSTEKLYGYGERDYYYFINHDDNVTLSSSTLGSPQNVFRKHGCARQSGPKNVATPPLKEEIALERGHTR